MKTNMSDERIKKIVSSEPAKPNTPSIMSAPHDKKATRQLLILVALFVSLAINIVLVVVSVSKNERMHQLESEIEDQKKLNLELKEKLNKANNF